MTEPLSLFRSTPVRLALVLVAVFSLANLLTLGGAYLKLRTDLLDTIETRVTEEIAGLDVSATPGALATLVRARAEAADPAKTVYAFLGSDGRRAGNALVVIDGSDVQLLATDPDRPLGNAGYLHQTRQLSGGLLVVAESLAPLERLRETFASLLVQGLVPTILLSLGLGMFIARRSAGGWTGSRQPSAGWRRATWPLGWTTPAAKATTFPASGRA